MVEQAYYQKPGHVIAAAVVLPVLDTLTVILWFYTRRKQRLPLQADDWLTIPAALLILGLGAGLITGVARHGLGYPTPALKAKRDMAPRSALTETNPEITIASEVEWAFYLMSIPALGCVKLSFLFFYRRVFCVVKKSVAGIVTMTMIVATAAWTISFFFAHLFACRTSFSAWWGSTVSLITRCAKTPDLGHSLAITDVVFDVVIIMIPIPLVWKLHMTTGRKLAVSMVFLLGSVAVAASTTRLVLVARAYKFGYNPHSDEDLTITLALYWGVIECCLGLFAACLPAIPFLFRGFSPESLIASIRSVFSPHSLHSRWRSRSPASKTYNAQDDSSAASHTRIVAEMQRENVHLGQLYATDQYGCEMV